MAFKIKNGVLIKYNEVSGVGSSQYPASVTEIAYGAFSDCTSLTSVTMPDSVKSISESAFEGCSDPEM